MEAQAGTSEGTPTREGVGGVVGVGLGLLILFSSVLGLAFSRATSLDADEQFAAWFEPAALAGGLQPVEAVLDASGTTMLRLENPEAAPEAAAQVVERKRSSSKDEEDSFDWRGIEIGPEGTPPLEALVLSWPLKRAEARLASLFPSGSRGSSRSGGGPPGRSRGGSRGRAFEDLYEGLGNEGGKRVLVRGTLEWGAFEAPFVQVREFEPGGTFVDTLRINLSVPTEALALILRWPRGLPASEARAEEFLASLKRSAP